MNETDISHPLISVVISTFNHGQYLPVALASIVRQSYPNLEIIVVDDGSTDDTKEIVAKYPRVKYYYQNNQGLSSARNLGVRKSKGAFLVFLDADDWFEPNTFEKNLSVLTKDPKLAFSSGSYNMLYAGSKDAIPVATSISGDHYLHFLKGNYIGMHATVMYRRWVFDTFNFDETLKSCEDYDLYLRVARSHPVYHHQEILATYHFHEKGLSHNYEVMIDSIRRVMQKQRVVIKGVREFIAFQKGKNQWKQYACLQSYKEHQHKNLLSIFQRRLNVFRFLRYNPQLLWKLLGVQFKRAGLRRSLMF